MPLPKMPLMVQPHHTLSAKRTLLGRVGALCFSLLAPLPLVLAGVAMLASQAAEAQTPAQKNCLVRKRPRPICNPVPSAPMPRAVWLAGEPCRSMALPGRPCVCRAIGTGAIRFWLPFWRSWLLMQKPMMAGTAC